VFSSFPPCVIDGRRSSRILLYGRFVGVGQDSILAMSLFRPLSGAQDLDFLNQRLYSFRHPRSQYPLCMSAMLTFIHCVKIPSVLIDYFLYFHSISPLNAL
jgi:hypothetical protein